VRKTSRVIVAHEDMMSWVMGGDCGADRDELFHDLDAPVRRVAAMDTFVAYQPVLEDAILPQPEICTGDGGAGSVLNLVDCRIAVN